MQTYVRHFVVFTIIAAGFEWEAFAQHPTMPPGMTHTEHLAQMQRDADLKKRGAAAMGVDQDATTHHFRLYESGGAIEVRANQPADQSTVAQVRAHLKEIAAEFTRGDFANARSFRSLSLYSLRSTLSRLRSASRPRADLVLQLGERGSQPLQYVGTCWRDAVHARAAGSLGFTGAQPSPAGHSSQQRVQRPRAQSVAMPLKLLKHPLPVHTLLFSMMQDVDLPESK